MTNYRERLKEVEEQKDETKANLEEESSNVGTFVSVLVIKLKVNHILTNKRSLCFYVPQYW